MRATGPTTCAFLSTDDVAEAAGASKAELRQSQSPGGGPGCEWLLGDDGVPLQLEFVPLAPEDAPPLPEGEIVDGPWENARWVDTSSTLYIENLGLSLLVRTSDSDPARAKTTATNVALLAVARN